MEKNNEGSITKKEWEDLVLVTQKKNFVCFITFLIMTLQEIYVTWERNFKKSFYNGARINSLLVAAKRCWKDLMTKL